LSDGIRRNCGGGRPACRGGRASRRPVPRSKARRHYPTERDATRAPLVLVLVLVVVLVVVLDSNSSSAPPASFPAPPRTTCTKGTRATHALKKVFRTCMQVYGGVFMCI